MSTAHRPTRLKRTLATSAGLALTLGCMTVLPAGAAIVPQPVSHAAQDAALGLTPVGTYETGQFDESAAEIVAHHAATQRLFVVNALAGAIDVLDISDPTDPVKLYTITDPAGGTANSVAIREDGLAVIALENPTKTDNGSLMFADATADEPTVLGSVTIGALPDGVAISEDGSYAVVANEGEPAEDFSIDPEGSISVVSLPKKLAAPKQNKVETAHFHDFEADAPKHPGKGKGLGNGNGTAKAKGHSKKGTAKDLPEDVRIFGPAPHGDDLPISRNLEPEYVAIQGGKAYVTLQEANSIAVVDPKTATVGEILALGTKDHGVEGMGIDTSDRDGGFNIRTVESLRGIYMPDGVDVYTAGGETYLVTANEGDAREWGDYVEDARVKDLGEDGLAPVCEDSPLAALTGDADLGRLKVTTADGLNADGTCYEELYAMGARSFSIWNTDGELVFDSGEALERVTHQAAPEFFNSNHSESNLEGRSDDKGPEPESVVIGQVGERTYAFVGLERVGGIAVFDVTDPASSEFVTYVNNRDFSESVEDGGDLAKAGDLGPEGLAFISAEDSPSGEPMLAVGNEVSGTTTLFAIADLAAR